VFCSESSSSAIRDEENWWVLRLGFTMWPRLASNSLRVAHNGT
jgi:hypothetical protein